MEQHRTPTIESGLIELAVDDRRSTAIHQLVASLQTEVNGTMYWLDDGSTASTYVLNEHLSRRRRQNSLQIARAFTAYQHFSLVRELVAEATPRVGMVVATNVGSLYQDDDVPEYEQTRLFESSLRVLREFASAYDVPVIISTPTCAGDYRDIVDEQVAETISCEETEFGLRFEGVDFQTTVYWDNGYWQTTIPYWVDLLGVADDGQEIPSATAIHGGQDTTPVPAAPSATEV